MRTINSQTLRLLLAVLCLTPFGSFSEVFAQDQGDRLVVFRQNQRFEGALPRGPLTSEGFLEELPRAMAFGPDDHLYVIRFGQTGPPFVEPRIARVEAEGTFSDLADIPLFGGEEILDFTFGPTGQIHILTFGTTVIAPPVPFQRILTLDPGSFELVDSQFLPVPFEDFLFAQAIATADDGLWLVAPEQLFEVAILDDEVESLGLDLVGLGVPLDADADSSGALWILTEPGIIDPPLFTLKRLDPVTGALTEARFDTGSGGPVAIHRRCQNHDTHRCLQGGRFRASVEWADFADGSGPGRLAPGSSADSTLFWFFDAANWELLVKVLDGCDNNGHFWVFAGATTDVQFELTVEDLETGEEWRFENPLGNPPRTVNDTFAFPGCP